MSLIDNVKKRFTGYSSSTAVYRKVVAPSRKAVYVLPKIHSYSIQGGKKIK